MYHVISRGRRICGYCEGRKLGVQRIEHAWQEVFKSWGFYATLKDKVIYVCNEDETNLKAYLVNRFRPDWLFLLIQCLFDVLVECDECEHCGVSAECEYSRMYSIWEALCKANGTNKKLVVIRFNPQKTNDEDAMKTLWQTLTYVFQHLSTQPWISETPVYLFATIGYSERRIRYFKRYDENFKPDENQEAVKLEFKALHDDKQFQTIETIMERLSNRIQRVALFDSTIYKGKLVFCKESGFYYATGVAAALREGCTRQQVYSVLNGKRTHVRGKTFKYICT